MVGYWECSKLEIKQGQIINIRNDGEKIFNSVHKTLDHQFIDKIQLRYNVFDIANGGVVTFNKDPSKIGQLMFKNNIYVCMQNDIKYEYNYEIILFVLN